MEPQSPRAPRMPSAPRAPRNGAGTGAEMEESRYVAEESAKGLVAGLASLDCADIIRRSNRVQEILDDFAAHAPKEEVTLEQLRARREKTQVEIDRLEQALDERDRKEREKERERVQSQRETQKQSGNTPVEKPRVVRVKDPRFASLFQNEPEENDTSKGWEPEL